MPRTASTNLKNSFAGSVITPALCVKVTDRLGNVKGFTNHNEVIVFDSQTYTPLASTQINAIKSTAGTGVDNTEVVDESSSTTYTIDEVKAFLLNDSEIEIFIVNYKHLDYGNCVLLSGKIGDINVNSDQIIRYMTRGKMQLLRATVGKVNAPTCWCKKLGDNECKADLTTHTHNRTATAVADEFNLTLGSDSNTSGYYTAGEITATSGNNNGFIREIKSHTLSSGTAVLVLREPFPYTVEVGDTFTVVKGCDRTITKCAEFVEVVTGDNNTVNFRGNPLLPGNRQLVEVGRTP